MIPPAFEEATQADVHILHLHGVGLESLIAEHQTETVDHEHQLSENIPRDHI